MEIGYSVSDYLNKIEEPELLNYVNILRQKVSLLGEEIEKINLFS